jgi:microcystin-dependent protein
MNSPLIGEITIFAGDSVPHGWMPCDGRLLAISKYTSLYTILGVTYGGDGRVTFALPNLNGRAPLQAGQGNGLSERYLGYADGQTHVTLKEAEMPSHRHRAIGSSDSGSQGNPTGAVWAVAGSRRDAASLYNTTSDSRFPMASDIVQLAGGSQPHNNLQPFLGLKFIIAIDGILPNRP